MKYLIGKKQEMSQAFRADGRVVPVTVIAAGPCTIAAVRAAGEGKVAIVGYGKKARPTKSTAKQFGEYGGFEEVRSVNLKEGEAPEVGTVVSVADFAPGDIVAVTGRTKGRGFQGVVKRHGFAGHPSTHGHKDQLRKSGSIGAGGVQRVFKGLRMPGRMGNEQVTIKNLEVIAIDTERNLVSVKGAIPGARGTLVTLSVTDGNVWQK